MTAPDARDELREYELSPDERLAVWLAANAPEIREPYRLGREIAEWAERLARVRAAEELEAAYEAIHVQRFAAGDGDFKGPDSFYAGIVRARITIRGLMDALAADDQPDGAR